MTPDRDPQVSLLNAVLQLGHGESFIVREKHVHCTAHRYKDGWTLYGDGTCNSAAYDRAILGWHFTDHEDLADFLLGVMPLELTSRFMIIGDRL